MHFNRRPDEEGIKTQTCLPPHYSFISTADLMKKGLRRDENGTIADPCISTADLMKKGLRQVMVTPAIRADCHFNRRPDEEGIKTPDGRPGQSYSMISTADLMKKGLRPAPWSASLTWTISTADLMKKGLRRNDRRLVPGRRDFNRRPDEEGIKTRPRGRHQSAARFQPQT